jgi:hypothetical protein
MKAREDIQRDSEILARRYLGGATLRELAGEYRCHWQVMSKYLKAAMSPAEYEAAGKEHTRQAGMQCDHKFQPGHAGTASAFRPGVLRGAAARKYVAVGTIRLRHRTNNRGRRVPWYYAIKYRDIPNGQARNWKPVSVYVWEAKHGKLPKGCFVVHRDGNRMNHSLENLKAVPRAGLLRHAQEARPNRFHGEAVRRKMAQVQRDRARLRNLRDGRIAV